jgi:hypothetical protein
MEAVAKSYMRKGFLIYEEMRKYLVIYEEAVSHIWLCNRSLLDFLIYEDIFSFFFISVVPRVDTMLCAQGRRNSWVELWHAGESGADSSLDAPRPRPVRPGAPSDHRGAQRRERGAKLRQHRGRGTTPADECNGQLRRILHLHRQQRAQVSPRFIGHPSSRPL